MNPSSFPLRCLCIFHYSGVSFRGDPKAIPWKCNLPERTGPLCRIGPPSLSFSGRVKSQLSSLPTSSHLYTALCNDPALTQLPPLTPTPSFPYNTHSPLCSWNWLFPPLQQLLNKICFQHFNVCLCLSFTMAIKEQDFPYNSNVIPGLAN